ncbi:Ribonuclease 3 [Stieleria magnilauensis]|uniref:Ribonuclease 3 n=2 Tax=Stieleria TaxID=2795973 RepID=A0ABX5XU14_9BACT|nr:Ribonuclease 3 [Planctomycetes bacterium TBK1r]
MPYQRTTLSHARTLSLPLDSESDDAELAPAGSLTDHLHCSDDHDDSFEKDPDDLDQERSKPVIDFDPPGTGDDVRLVASPRDESGDLDHSEKLIRCQQLIDYQFKDQELLRFALTHASGASHRLASNERLEFLGDSILGFVICSWLYEEYPEYNEGDLTKIKSAVVSRRTCGKVACQIGLDECLIVGRGVTRNRSYPRSLVSDVFESIVAALYLDGGHDIVRDRLKTWLRGEVEMAVTSQGATNYKSTLQQRAQRDIACTPLYRLKREMGPDHRKSFLISAVIDGEEYTAAWGTNKKEAEQKAAANALAEMNDDPLPYPLPEDPNS